MIILTWGLAGFFVFYFIGKIFNQEFIGSIIGLVIGLLWGTKSNVYLIPVGGY